jgi:hypothetical protein
VVAYLHHGGSLSYKERITPAGFVERARTCRVSQSYQVAAHRCEEQPPSFQARPRTAARTMSLAADRNTIQSACWGSSVRCWQRAVQRRQLTVGPFHRSKGPPYSTREERTEREAATLHVHLVCLVISMIMLLLPPREALASLESAHGIPIHSAAVPRNVLRTSLTTSLQSELHQSLDLCAGRRDATLRSRGSLRPGCRVLRVYRWRHVLHKDTNHISWIS